MTRGAVDRLSRAIDLVSVLLIFVGATMYLQAYSGMVDVRDSPGVPFVPGTVEVFALTNQYLRLNQLSYAGLGLVAAGIAVGLSAAARAHKIRRRDAAENPLTE